jgi:two-component sensor histidine kinase
LGISRFDGLNFLHFSNPQQSSLGMMDISEDGQGRIWCHNFSGQIFYIEQGKMILLQEFDGVKETQYPRTVLCGDELLATSDRGLFVCSTINLKCTYLSTNSRSVPSHSSLAVFDSKAVLFDNGNWYVYIKNRGIKQLKVDSLIRFADNNLISLQPATIGATFFVIANPVGIIQMITLKGDSLHLAATLDMNDFVNAVTINDQTWLHTRNESKTLDGKWTIKGQSLTDVVKDKEGNIWFSSLRKGLLVNYKKPQWELIKSPLENEDFVRCLNVTDGYFFAGTNKGNLFVLDSSLSKINWENRLFDGYGSIDFIRFFKSHTFVVGSSINTYVVNPVEKKIKNLLPLFSVKDVDFDENTLYIATDNGFYMMPYLDSINLPVWIRLKQKQFPFVTYQNFNDAFLFTAGRSWSVRFDRSLGSLFFAFKNGLHQINRKGIHPFYINKKEVFASSMWYKQPRLFIGTYSDGLWIKTGNKLRHFTTANYLTSNTILRTKATQNHLWLFENETMQVMNIETESLLNIDLPKINGANVFDVAEWQGYGYLTTSEGIYKIPMNESDVEAPPEGYLETVIVNNKDTLQSTNIKLPYYKNDVQFILSSPVFYDASTISFHYRIAGIDKEWQTTRTGQRVLRYASLAPGNYTFEAYAINNKGGRQKQMITFSVSINRPWWKQEWFYTLFFLIVATFIYFLEQYRVRQLLKVEHMRRKISGDLHDDIGATLSSINIYSELVKKEKRNETYINAIQQHAKEVIEKLDELIWSINPRNDNFEQLINRMQSYGRPLLQAKGIATQFNYAQGILKERLPVQVKQNLYLVYKELINNTVKHSGAGMCRVDINCRDNVIYLIVMDDGKGFDVKESGKGRNGIYNIKERVEKMKGRLTIESILKKGTTVMVSVPLPNDYIRDIKVFFRKLLNK